MSEEEPVDGTMPFLAHLEELRATLVHSVLAWVIGMVLVLPFFGYIRGFFLHPWVKSGHDAADLKLFEILSPFTIIMKFIMWGGFALALPFIVYFIMRFIFPGLLQKEKMAVRRYSFVSVALFFFGMSLCYFYTLPYTIRILDSMANFLAPAEQVEDLGVEWNPLPIKGADPEASEFLAVEDLPAFPSEILVVSNAVMLAQPMVVLNVIATSGNRPGPLRLTDQTPRAGEVQLAYENGMPSLVFAASDSVSQVSVHGIRNQAAIGLSPQLQRQKIKSRSEVFFRDYVSFVLKLLLAFGLSFQLPVVTYALGYLGVVNSLQMAAKRRHVFVGLLVLAMFLTPPDAISQVIMAVPLFIMYEITIVLVRRKEKRDGFDPEAGKFHEDEDEESESAGASAT